VSLEKVRDGISETDGAFSPVLCFRNSQVAKFLDARAHQTGRTMKVLSILGLTFNMAGAVIVAWGAVSILATWFRHHGFGEYTYERQHAAWYERIAVRVSNYLLDSPNVFKMNPDSEMQVLSATFWAVMFLLIGFAFQLLGVVFNS
jgi:hypothetical protein